MADHPNVTLVRSLFAAFARTDVAAIQQLIPEDAVWRFPGRRGQIAGEHRGRDAIFSFLMTVGALTDHTFHLDLIDVVGAEHNVVALFRGSAQRGDKTLDNPTCLRFEMRDGRIREISEFVWDLYHVDDFWS